MYIVIFYVLFIWFIRGEFWVILVVGCVWLCLSVVEYIIVGFIGVVIVVGLMVVGLMVVGLMVVGLMVVEDFIFYNIKWFYKFE